jgi:predicted ABC-type ATPase
MPDCYVIGGPNGAGKTTAAMTVLPDLRCLEYVNADEIARGLSPFNPGSVAMKAGRLLLERIHELADAGQSFAFESTLASRSFVPFLRQCQRNGYDITLIYLWLNSPALAQSRVEQRVREGGHSILAEVVKRRYYRSSYNLLTLYLPFANNWSVYDNSGHCPLLLGEGGMTDSLIYNAAAWQNLMRYATHVERQ